METKCSQTEHREYDTGTGTPSPPADTVVTRGPLTSAEAIRALIEVEARKITRDNIPAAMSDFLLDLGDFLGKRPEGWCQ
jgi:hypothetical protein